MTSPIVLLGGVGMALAWTGLALAARWRRLRRTSTSGRRMAARRAAAWPLRVLSLWLMALSLVGVLQPQWPTLPYAVIWGVLVLLLVVLPLQRGLRRRARTGTGGDWTPRSTAAVE